MFMWKRSFQLPILFACILVAATSVTAEQDVQETEYQEALRALKDLFENKTTMEKDKNSENKLEGDKEPNNDEWIHIHAKVRDEQGSEEGSEDDAININTVEKTFIDVINQNGKKEITFSDYNKGVIAVLTLEDKTCRVMEMSTEDKNVDLEKEKEVFKGVSQKGEEANFTEDGVTMFRESRQEVTEEEVGEKILLMCKGYKTIWMEEVDEDSEPDDEDNVAESTTSDKNDGIKRILANVGHSVQKRGCDTVTVYQCVRKCASVTYHQTTYCCKRGWWSSSCKKMCHRQDEVDTGCHNVCRNREVQKCNSWWG